MTDDEASRRWRSAAARLIGGLRRDRGAGLGALDASDAADRAAMALIPPAELRRRVSGTSSYLEYVRTAVEYATILKAVGGLRSHDAALEPGCGAGRVAAALTAYLRPPGSYRGFDIHLPSIEFARRAFEDACPHFRFDHADVRTEYFLDPRGTFDQQAVPAGEYRFPYPDASVDFVFTVSLFTHLLPAATWRFLTETGRVLRPGGRGLLSAWILDHQIPGQGVQFVPYPSHERLEREGLVPQGQRTPRAPAPYVGFSDPASPTAGVAYSLAFLEEALGCAGLRIGRVIPGRWSEQRREWITLLDILTFAKA